MVLNSLSVLKLPLNTNQPTCCTASCRLVYCWINITQYRIFYVDCSMVQFAVWYVVLLALMTLLWGTVTLGDNLNNFKGTLHSKLTLGFFFSWPKSLYYCDLSLTNCTFVKLELRVQGTCFYGDAGEFDGRRGINLGIWYQWLYGHELDGAWFQRRCTARGGDKSSLQTA